jgi:dihydrofolate reductase
MGKNAFALAEDPDWYAENYEFQVPIFVLTHEIPNRRPKETNKLSFTFVTDGIESTIEQAKSAAGSNDISVIGGASIAQQCLKAGLVDELHIDLMPVLLCGGLTLFEDFGTKPIQLERINMVNLAVGRTSFKFRVVK